jgi:hypothetical protein
MYVFDRENNRIVNNGKFYRIEEESETYFMVSVKGRLGVWRLDKKDVVESNSN